MVQNICEVVTEYEKHLQEMPFMLRSSYRCVMLREDSVKGQWVFGGVEWGSGRTFLVPVPDRTADTLTTIIHAWIEPGTTVISDCWGAYCDLDSQGYMHRTLNHNIRFINQDTGDHTNTMESTSCSIKVFLEQYNGGEEYHYHLAHYMFAAWCKAQGIPPFLHFLHPVANTNWSICEVPCSSACAMWCSCQPPSGMNMHHSSATASLPSHHTTSCYCHGNNTVVDDCCAGSNLGAMILQSIQELHYPMNRRPVGIKSWSV